MFTGGIPESWTIRTVIHMSEAAIEVENLRKRFKDVTALDGIDLVAPAGTILGLLGPNGAGKTTAVRILTTLLEPDAGEARVAGLDVKRDANALRAHIGLAGQYAAVDENLTGFENLEMVGRLYHLPRRQARERAGELLVAFGLEDAGDRMVKTYSGGMRRRLDLGAALVARPPVLFLDEPTTGLDPRSRIELWGLLEELVRDGATLMLTTQYLEEADRLADDIVVLDRGRVAAAGSPAELKAHVGGERMEITVASAQHLAPAAAALEQFADGPSGSDVDSLQVTVPVRPGTRLMEVALALDGAAVQVTDVHRREATLDDVFLTLTGAGDAPRTEVNAA